MFPKMMMKSMIKSKNMAEAIFSPKLVVDSLQFCSIAYLSYSVSQMSLLVGTIGSDISFYGGFRGSNVLVNHFFTVEMILVPEMETGYPSYFLPSCGVT